MTDPSQPRATSAPRRPDLVPPSIANASSDSELGLQKLFIVVERQGLEAVAWYKTDRRAERRYSRVLSLVLAVILLASFGVLAPLLAVVSTLPSTWGFIAVGQAAPWVGLGRFNRSIVSVAARSSRVPEPSSEIIPVAIRMGSLSTQGAPDAQTDLCGAVRDASTIL